MRKKKALLEPIPPGEILLEEFLIPYGISQNKLSRDIDVPLTRVNEIIRGKRRISADTALRLSRYFNTSPDLWLGLQTEYDLRVVSSEIGKAIKDRITPYEQQIIKSKDIRTPY